ncbi:MAG: helix-turn-helix transcriptional regulator [Clostridia bacterium]|nr:helix-turn-helix transcriptional regulator [Clostridia bacterium]
MSRLGQRLRLLREHRNLSLYDVERLTGLHYSTVGKYERGVRRPSIETLRELARVYEVSLRELIPDEDSDAEPAPGSALDLDRWTDLLRVRPVLGRLLDAVAGFSDERVEHLVAFFDGSDAGADTRKKGRAGKE